MTNHHPAAVTPSVLTHLRGLTPQRLLTLSEALHIAERQAIRLLELQGVDQLPVPDEVVTSLPRLEVRSDDHMPETMLGCGDWDRFRRIWVITVSARSPHPQRRVTMLHEYKHILDHGFPGLAARRRSDVVELGTAPEELIADFFAVSVLMPRTALKAAWAELRQDVAQLAAAFDVPVRAMAARLDQLGLMSGNSMSSAAERSPLDTGYSTDLGRRFSSRVAWSCPERDDERGAA